VPLKLIIKNYHPFNRRVELYWLNDLSTPADDIEENFLHAMFERKSIQQNNKFTWDNSKKYEYF